ncbi:MAG: SHOCT domain-containing protein [Deltaproteobacteria bacterium]|nr:SHOCT domain-containing protein [Deltaproteobacteria bacterium]
MYNWQGTWHMGGVWMVLWWIAGVAVVAAVIWLLASRPRNGPPMDNDSPETILKRRYARGEIDRDEYLRRLEDFRK